MNTQEQTRSIEVDLDHFAKRAENTEEAKDIESQAMESFIDISNKGILEDHSILQINSELQVVKDISFDQKERKIKIVVDSNITDQQLMVIGAWLGAGISACFGTTLSLRSLSNLVKLGESLGMSTRKREDIN
jgi:hypothetical protein